MAQVLVRAGIYARISSDREGDGLGVNRQLEDCTQLAELRGWAVAETYVDDDVSAYSGKLRPEYARMLDDLRMGTINGVLVYHPTVCTGSRRSWRSSSTFARTPVSMTWRR